MAAKVEETMLYELAHWLQSKYRWIWRGIEILNAAVSGLKIAGRNQLEGCLMDDMRLVDVDDAGRLADFFARQPKESYKWFSPHAFDESALKRLLRNRSYIIYVQELNGEIIGYAFLRCFINGKCFLGKMVDVNHRGQGVCTKLCKVGMAMAVKSGLRMFESINKENIGSMKASQKACDVIVVEELEGGDLLIEDRPKGSLEP